MTSFQRAARVATKKPATTVRTATVSQRERLVALAGGESESTAAHPSGPGVCLPRPFPLPSWRSGSLFRIKEESALMAVKVVHVSDISGKEADEQSLGRLVVHEH